MPELTIPETISYKEAVELCSCSRRTLERAVEQGAITAFKPGAEVRLVKDEVIKWFHSKKVRPRFRQTGRPRRTVIVNGV